MTSNQQLHEKLWSLCEREFIFLGWPWTHMLLEEQKPQLEGRAAPYWCSLERAELYGVMARPMPSNKIALVPTRRDPPEIAYPGQHLVLDDPQDNDCVMATAERAILMAKLAHPLRG